ncbi:sulfotransferase 1C3-like [Saccoglossus kowalevskii]|uniref:Sulfotransferase 1C3-like n=1 Tax=Saccoglossus kowalevskii TaxID=10224 RepID=A0ABM0M5H5_SACKO|nr:PREDICTED: sulfotransferase 1C3-like [Saccoglossus kowalevskii]
MLPTGGKEKDDDNVLFFKYEDIVKDLEGTVKMVCTFMEKTLTLENLRGIAENCTFEAMKKQKVRDYVCEFHKIDPPLSLFVRKGTALVSEIVWGILSCSGVIDTEEPLDKCLYPEMQVRLSKPNYEVLADMSSPRIIGTHLPPSFLPPQLFVVRPKIVYVARNPKDLAVSFHHHLSVIPSNQTYTTFKHFIDDFMSGKVILGDWPTQVTYWWKKKDDDNVLYLKYEDIVKDLEETVKMICTFMGNTLTLENIRGIAENCTFEAMKKRKVRDHICEFYKIDPHLSPFVRKGKVGCWKQHFTVSQNDEFDKWYKKAVQGTGLSFDFLTNTSQNV